MESANGGFSFEKTDDKSRKEIELRQFVWEKRDLSMFVGYGEGASLKKKKESEAEGRVGGVDMHGGTGSQRRYKVVGSWLQAAVA